jgi:hypothetical protein
MATAARVDAAQPVFVVMNLCVFADGFAIEAFGLWYHANDIVIAAPTWHRSCATSRAIACRRIRSSPDRRIGSGALPRPRPMD